MQLRVGEQSAVVCLLVSRDMSPFHRAQRNEYLACALFPARARNRMFWIRTRGLAGTSVCIQLLSPCHEDFKPNQPGRIVPFHRACGSEVAAIAIAKTGN